MAASVVVKKGNLSVRAYRGDAKTLLAFNLTKAATKRLAGFTIQYLIPNGQPRFLLNQLQFQKPADHAQDASLPANSSLNAPIHKFRWLHVPGAGNQGPNPVFGTYKYTVTPRYFDENQKLTPLDASLSASVSIDVGPFTKGKVSLGFTRGFVQSQAFVRHFGLKALIQPKTHTLDFDTTDVSGKDAQGKTYTFADQYQWLGFTARQRILDMLDAVIADTTLRLDVFAYDLNEPDVIKRLLKLARRGSLRIILDNASLHKSTAKKKAPEDEFEKMFNAAKKGQSAILRGHFQRYSHDKVFIVSKGKTARTVLTGSTNLSITGVYVNSNHVLVFDDPVVASTYAAVFQAAWDSKTSAAKFRKDPLSLTPFTPSSNKSVSITFSPHDDATAKAILDGMAARIAAEGKKGVSTGSVLFAVMDVGGGSGSVLPALKAVHALETVFSYGISDNPGGIALYKPGKKTGVLVTGKPSSTKLPKPFSQVPGVGRGHQVHHKFVVCGFNGSDPVVYCGSSNLAQGGEVANGDNLLAIHDEDVATAFALEALALVDHFDFLDSAADGPKSTKTRNSQPAASKTQTAVDAGWFLSTTDNWVQKYYDADDLKSADRQLFA
jgi:phosphatidylserine/phosphatidylglycerophosphate/cardiolipin synthase-like enzyme